MIKSRLPKILIIVAILLIAIITMNLIINTYANDNETENERTIGFQNEINHGIFVYNRGINNNGIISGATYDEQTNTLTLNNMNTKGGLITYGTGDDFKINVIGENSIGYIECKNAENVTITGKGTLNVNQSQKNENAVIINSNSSEKGINFTVEKTVNVNLYASQHVFKTHNKGIAPTVILENGQTVNITEATLPGYNYVYEIAKVIDFIVLDEPIQTDKIYTKDGQTYHAIVMEYDEDDEVEPPVYMNHLLYDEKYGFIEEADWIYYRSMEDMLNAGYTKSNQYNEATINYRADYFKWTTPYYYQDNDGNTYIIVEKGETGYTLYNVTDDIILSSDGYFHRVVEENRAITEEEKENYNNIVTVANSYVEDCYIIDNTKLEIKAGSEEEERIEPEIKVLANGDNPESENVAKTEVEKYIKDIINEKPVNGITVDTANKIKKAVNEGKTIIVNVLSNPIAKDMAEDDVKKIEATLSSKTKVAKYFSINVRLTTSEGELLGSITEFEKEIPITISLSNTEEDGKKVEDILGELPTVPEGYTRIFKMVRVHNGVVDEIDATIGEDSNGGKGKIAKFKSKLFSTYVLTYEDIKNNTSIPETGTTTLTPIDNNTNTTNTSKGDAVPISNTNKESENSNPKTGDEVITYIASIIWSINVLLVIKIRKKALVK